MAVRKLRKLQQDQKVNYSITLPRVLVEEVAHIRNGTDCIVVWVPMGTPGPALREGYFAVYTLRAHVRLLVQRLCAGDVEVVDEILQHEDIAVDMLVSALESAVLSEMSTRILPVLLRMGGARVVLPALDSIMTNIEQHPRQCPICGHAYAPLKKRLATNEESEIQLATNEESEMIDVIDGDFAVAGTDFKRVGCEGGIQHICRDCYDAVNHDIITLMQAF